MAAMALLASCGTSGYELSSVSRQRILVDRRFDTHPDKRAVAFIALPSASGQYNVAGSWRGRFLPCVVEAGECSFKSDGRHHGVGRT